MLYSSIINSPLQVAPSDRLRLGSRRAPALGFSGRCSLTKPHLANQFIGAAHTAASSESHHVQSTREAFIRGMSCGAIGHFIFHSCRTWVVVARRSWRTFPAPFCFAIRASAPIRTHRRSTPANSSSAIFSRKSFFVAHGNQKQTGSTRL